MQSSATLSLSLASPTPIRSRWEVYGCNCGYNDTQFFKQSWPPLVGKVDEDGEEEDTFK
jgi:hypothetical protein